MRNAGKHDGSHWDGVASLVVLDCVCVMVVRAGWNWLRGWIDRVGLIGVFEGNDHHYLDRFLIDIA